MNIAILADIHSNFEALKAIDKKIKEEVGEYSYINAGDTIDYGAEPIEVISYLTNYMNPLTYFGRPVGCLGNHDLAIIGNDFSRFRTRHGRLSADWSRYMFDADKRIRDYLLQDWIQLVPSEYGTILVSHGNDIDPWYNLFEKDTDTMGEMIKRNPAVHIFVTAHTHLQFCTIHNSKIFINPGSVGQSRNGVAKAHATVLTEGENGILVKDIIADYDIDKSASAIQKQPQLDNFLATRLYLGI